MFLNKCLYHMLMKFEQNSTKFWPFLTKSGFLKPFLTKHWRHFGRRFCSWNNCLMTNYWFLYHLSVFRLRQSDTCNYKLKLHQTWQTRLIFKTKTSTVALTSSYQAIFCNMVNRVIHEKSNFKCLTSSSVILFIIVIKYIMQNFSNFEKSLEGAIPAFQILHTKSIGILVIFVQRPKHDDD